MSRGRCIECPESVGPEESDFQCLTCTECVCFSHAEEHLQGHEQEAHAEELERRREARRDSGV